MPRQLHDGDPVGQRPGERLVDEHRLPRCEHGQCLLEVGAPVNRLEQHHVDTADELAKGIDHLDAQPPELRLDLRPDLQTGRDVLGPFRVRSDHPVPADVRRGIRVVQHFCELQRVPRVHADDAHTPRRVGGVGHHTRRVDLELVDKQPRFQTPGPVPVGDHTDGVGRDTDVPGLDRIDLGRERAHLPLLFQRHTVFEDGHGTESLPIDRDRELDPSRKEDPRRHRLP